MNLNDLKNFFCLYENSIVPNVGVGTTNPQSKLDVNGIIRATEICDESGANCKDISTGWGSAPSDSSYATKGIVQFLTDAATSGITVSSGVASVNAGTSGGAGDANKIAKLNGSGVLATAMLPTIPIGSGGTNSSTALSNNFVMVSSGGSIVESATITTTELGLLNGITTPLLAEGSYSNASFRAKNSGGTMYDVSSAVGSVIYGDATGWVVGTPDTAGLVVKGATNQTIDGTKTFSNAIVSPGVSTASNADLTLSPNGTGKVVVSKALVGTLGSNTDNANTTINLGSTNIFNLSAFVCDGTKTITLQNAVAGSAYTVILGANQSGNACIFYGNNGSTLAKFSGGATARTPASGQPAVFTFIFTDTNTAYGSMVDNMQ